MPILNSKDTQELLFVCDKCKSQVGLFSRTDPKKRGFALNGLNGVKVWCSICNPRNVVDESQNILKQIMINVS